VSDPAGRRLIQKLQRAGLGQERGHPRKAPLTMVFAVMESEAKPAPGRRGIWRGRRSEGGAVRAFSSMEPLAERALRREDPSLFSITWSGRIAGVLETERQQLTFSQNARSGAVNYGA